MRCSSSDAVALVPIAQATYPIKKCSRNKPHCSRPTHLPRLPVPNRQCCTAGRWLSLTAAGILSAARNGATLSSGAPRPCAHAHSPPFHQRGAALPACICLTDLCPPSCCYTRCFSAEKGGLPVVPLQPFGPIAISRCHVRSSPFFPLHTTRCGIAVSRYYPAFTSVNPRHCTVTTMLSCGKANLYIILSFSPSQFQYTINQTNNNLALSALHHSTSPLGSLAWSLESRDCQLIFRPLLKPNILTPARYCRLSSLLRHDYSDLPSTCLFALCTYNV